MIIPSYGKQPLITADTIQLSSLTMDRLADGTEYKRIKSAALTADHLIFLDAVVASGVYGLVANTDISAGHIYLSTTIKDSSNRTVSDAEKGVWDDKAKTFRQDAAPTTGMQAGDIWYDTNDGDKPYTYDGADWIASYTEIDGGYLTTGIIDCTKVTVRSVSGANKIEINANEIAGYAGATKQFYITAASGVAYCGTGAVVLDSSGISIQGASLKFKDQATGNVIGGAYGVLSSVEIYVESGVVLQLDSDGYASDMIMGFANVRPMQNGTMLLGGSSYRWSHGYINRVYANTRLQIPVGTDCYD